MHKQIIYSDSKENWLFYMHIGYYLVPTINSCSYVEQEAKYNPNTTAPVATTQ